MFRVPKRIGLVQIDIGEDGSPDEREVNVVEYKDYWLEHSGPFKLKHGADWCGPMMAAFFGQPAEDWSEGRASWLMAYLNQELSRLKKAEPAFDTPAPPASTAG